jgi:GntR family transcriptional regulator
MAVQVAKYVAVREHLRNRIASMDPGSRLPSENELCAEYNVSRITARRAIDDLALEGIVMRQQGRGTFVSERRFVQRVRESFGEQVTGFYRQQVELGREVTTSVIQDSRCHDLQAAESLRLRPVDDLILLERLRYVDGELHQHVVTYLSAAKYPKVLTQDFSKGSLFDFLSHTYDVRLARNDILVRIDHVSGDLAQYLNVVQGEAVLTMDSTVFDDSGTPIAYGIAHLTPKNGEVYFSVDNHPS